VPDFYFVLFAVALLSGGGVIVLSRNPAWHLAGFLAVMLAVAGLFALLNQSFLFLAQVMVGVGAVVVLSLIVVSSINLRESALPPEPRRGLWLAGAVAVVAPFAWMLYRTLLTLAEPLPELPEGFGTARSLGRSLFGDWVLPFEVLSLLLLAAMVGAIVIGRAGKHEKKERP